MIVEFRLTGKSGRTNFTFKWSDVEVSEKMILEIGHRRTSISTELAVMEGVFMNSLVLIEDFLLAGTVVAILALENSILPVADFAHSVEMRCVSLEISFRKTDKLTVFFLALELAVIVFGDHVRGQAIFLYCCVEFTVAASSGAVDIVIFLHFPVKALSMLVEELQMIFWKTNSFCQLFEFFWDFYFLF